MLNTFKKRNNLYFLHKAVDQGYGGSGSLFLFLSPRTTLKISTLAASGKAQPKSEELNNYNLRLQPNEYSIFSFQNSLNILCNLVAKLVGQKKIYSFLKKTMGLVYGMITFCLEMVVFHPGRCRIILYIFFLTCYNVGNSAILFADGEASASENSEKSNKFGWQGAVFFAVSVLAVLISQASTFGGGGGEDAVLASAVDSLANWISDCFQSSKEISSETSSEGPDPDPDPDMDGPEPSSQPSVVNLEKERSEVVSVENDPLELKMAFLDKMARDFESAHDKMLWNFLSNGNPELFKDDTFDFLEQLKNYLLLSLANGFSFHGSEEGRRFQDVVFFIMNKYEASESAEGIEAVGREILRLLNF